MTYWITSETHSGEPEIILWKNGAYGKARHDIEQTLVRELQFKPLSLYTYAWDDEPTESLDRHFTALFAGVKRGDIVFIQWIILSSMAYKRKFFEQAHENGAKVVVIIHDLGHWIQFDEEESRRAVIDGHQDIVHLLDVDGIIVHSERMRERLLSDLRLLKHDVDPIMTSLDIFGFTTFQGAKKERTLKPSIDYVGNLHKSTFINGMTDAFEMNIYGPNPELYGLDVEKRENIRFRGSYDHEALPTMLEGSFGLVWASTAYPQKVGRDAEYQRYNAPHKASLYLAADLPIIVSSDSARATFVERQGIGLVVDDLDQLTEKYKELTEESYADILENTRRIGRMIRENFPIKKAVIQMLEFLEWER